jgi:hypothetical protein
MQEKKISVIKSYVKAKSPEGLKLAMIKNNIDTNAYYSYSIIFDGSFWFAWFDFDASTIIENETRKALNGKLGQR